MLLIDLRHRRLHLGQFHETIINPLIGRERDAPGDEVFILSMTVASLMAR
jgi:hypothetical protein